MEGIDEARNIATRVRAGERVAMRRWLRRKGVDQCFFSFSSLAEAEKIEDEMEAEIIRLGGNPEEVRQFGRDCTVDALCKYRGFDGD